MTDSDLVAALAVADDVVDLDPVNGAALKRVLDRSLRIQRTLESIAYCDDEDRPEYEPHPLYRSHMIAIAKRALVEAGHD